MKNIELIKDELEKDFAAVAAAETPEEFTTAQMVIVNKISDTILKEAKNCNLEEISNIVDAEILKARGLDKLTNEEINYYNKIIEGKGFEGTEELLPATVIDRIFRDIQEEFEILDYIQFINTTGQTSFLSTNSEFEGGIWGELNSEITKELEASFKVINTGLHKLSAYVIVSNDMLELGPLWIDRYVRLMLARSISIGLEKAIIKGNGVKQPVGMLKDITKDKNPSTGYPDREEVVIKSLTPAEIGAKIMDPLTKDRKRPVKQLLFVVNPHTYWTKIYPATTMLTDTKEYKFNILPINAKVIQSIHLDDDKMLVAIPEDYFLGVGLKESVKSSTDFRFLEDQKVYKQKLLGNGMPLETNSFMLCDISAIDGAVPIV